MAVCCKGIFSFSALFKQGVVKVRKSGTIRAAEFLKEKSRAASFQATRLSL
jgi:hypothetical protein